MQLEKVRYALELLYKLDKLTVSSDLQYANPYIKFAVVNEGKLTLTKLGLFEKLAATELETVVKLGKFNVVKLELFDI